MKHNHLKLMIPGPVQPKDEVLNAMGSPVRAHYGPEFRDLYNETTDLLKTVFGTQGDVFVLVGSGSSAIDAVIGSCVPTGEKIIIGINGFFGERMKAIAEAYQLEVIPVYAGWGKPIAPSDVKTALRKHPEAWAVGMVHLETSTTIINPIEDIGRVTRQFKTPYIVDAVSSLGGLPIKMDEWGIDFCASASQKCLGAPPGLAPVAVGKRGWEAIQRDPNPGHGWYLNLRVWRQYVEQWGDWHPFPITMASNNLLALNVALKGLLEEGIPTRLNRYRRLALRLRAGLRACGMEPFTSDDEMAPVLTGAYGPPGVPTGEIVDYMAEVHRIKISGGLGADLKNRIFRIGHMAPTIDEGDIDHVIDGLSSFTPNWRRETGS
jgi:alanine-glyoxylate transaminase/serine-glyoxylate transaminase/serine-pyruvate transaminase